MALTGQQLELFLALDPVMQATFLAHSAEYARRFGAPLTLTSTRRSRAEQERLHAEAPELAVSPGRSKHEIGMAYDFGGPVTDAQWDAAGAIAQQQLGMRWGGRWHTPERWHVEAKASRAELLTIQRATVLGGLGLVALGLVGIARAGGEA